MFVKDVKVHVWVSSLEYISMQKYIQVLRSMQRPRLHVRRSTVSAISLLLLMQSFSVATTVKIQMPKVRFFSQLHTTQSILSHMVVQHTSLSLL